MNYPNSFQSALIAILAMATGAFAAQNGNLNSTAQKTLRDLAQGSMAEVQLGQLAQQKSSSAPVKQFAARMVEDHGALLNQVKQVANQEHFQLPAKLNAQQTAEFQRLKSMQGKTFDDAYMNYMLKDHQQDIQMLPKDESKIHNPAVYSLVQKTQPILENHLRAAEHTAGEIGVPAQTGMNKPIHPKGVASRSANPNQGNNNVQYQNQVNQKR